MNLIFNGPFTYQGWWESVGTCGVRAYRDPAGQRPSVVVATEVKGGWTSVTNRAGPVFEAVCGYLGLDAETSLFVIHNEGDDQFKWHPLGEDRFQLVEFEEPLKGRKRVRTVAWLKRTLLDVERLCGGVLPALNVSPVKAGQGRPS